MSLPRDITQQIDTYTTEKNTLSFFSLTDLINEVLELGLDPRRILNDAIIREHRCISLNGSLPDRILSIISPYTYTISLDEDEIYISLFSIDEDITERIYTELTRLLPTVSYQYIPYENEYIDIGEGLYTIQSPNIEMIYNDIQSIIECRSR